MSLFPGSFPEYVALYEEVQKRKWRINLHATSAKRNVKGEIIEDGILTMITIANEERIVLSERINGDLERAARTLRSRM